MSTHSKGVQMEKLTGYISGPYSNGDTAIHVRNAMEAYHILSDRGYYPYCPHVTHFLHMHHPRGYEFWMDQDLLWVAKCDFLVRLPGESSGADREVNRAIELKIPVIILKSLAELRKIDIGV
jgi:hypothetical protein